MLSRDAGLRPGMAEVLEALAAHSELAR
jgi:hypothetical protein